MSSEFEDHLVVPRRRLWIAALVALVAGSAAVVAVALRSSEESTVPKDATHRPTPPPRGAFATGGAPSGADPALVHALEETLPDWVIALDRLTTAARENDPSGFDDAERAMASAREQLLGPKVRNVLGRTGTDRLRDVLDRAKDAAGAARETDAKKAADWFLEAVGAFNDALAAAGHGFYLDGDVISGPNSRRIVLLYMFRVVHVRLFESGTRRIRALQLRRLDKLNWTHRLLGFTSPHLREALVLLDQVDELLVNYVLPALSPGANVELFDEASVQQPTAWQERVRARAGQVIRTEYAATQGIDAAATVHLGQLLLARRRLFDQWSHALERRGIVLRQPRTLRIERFDDLRRMLDGAVPDSELDELDELERSLHAKANDRVFDAVRDVIIASVERHEVQHRIDAALPKPRPVPHLLEEYTGPLLDRRGEQRELVQLARDELSAYLAELARDRLTTRVNLTLISRFMFDRERWGSAECYAALVIFEGLAKELGVEIEGELVHRGSIDRELLADIYLAITDRPEDKLRAAAQALWERLFEASMPAIEIVHNDLNAAGGDDSRAVGAGGL